MGCVAPTALPAGDSREEAASKVELLVPFPQALKGSPRSIIWCATGQVCEKATDNEQRIDDIWEFVCVTTVAGVTYEVAVPRNPTPWQLRERVADAIGASALSLRLLDSSGNVICSSDFKDTDPMESVPRGMLAVVCPVWALIPSKLHHPDMKVSPDRLRVEHSAQPAVHEACYLSGPLGEDCVYTLDIRVEGRQRSCIWLGVVSDTMRDWSYLMGCFFCDYTGLFEGVCDFYFRNGVQPEGSSVQAQTYEAARVMQAFCGNNPVRMRLDTRLGILDLLDSRNNILVHHEEPRFVTEAALRFCVSLMHPGTAVTIVGSHVEESI